MMSAYRILCINLNVCVYLVFSMRIWAVNKMQVGRHLLSVLPQPLQKVQLVHFFNKKFHLTFHKKIM